MVTEEQRGFLKRQLTSELYTFHESFAGFRDHSDNSTRFNLQTAIAEWRLTPDPDSGTAELARVIEEKLKNPDQLGDQLHAWQEARYGNDAVASALLGCVDPDQLIELLSWGKRVHREENFGGHKVFRSTTTYPIADMLARAPYIPLPLAMAASTLSYGAHADAVHAVYDEGLRQLTEQINQLLGKPLGTQIPSLDAARLEGREALKSSGHGDSEKFDDLIKQLEAGRRTLAELSPRFAGNHAVSTNSTSFVFAHFVPHWPESSGELPMKNYLLLSERALFVGDCDQALVVLHSSGREINDTLEQFDDLEKHGVGAGTILGAYAAPLNAPLGSKPWGTAQRDLAAHVQMLRAGMGVNSKVVLAHSGDRNCTRFAKAVLRDLASGIDRTVKTAVGSIARLERVATGPTARSMLGSLEQDVARGRIGAALRTGPLSGLPRPGIRTARRPRSTPNS